MNDKERLDQLEENQKRIVGILASHLSAEPLQFGSARERILVLCDELGIYHNLIEAHYWKYKEGLKTTLDI